MLGKLLQGRYQIVQVLSAGGFCQTYLAEDTWSPNHPACVVKHLLRSSDQPESLQTLRQLFTREAEALKKLGNYERVPQLLAHFEENREFYLVQEFISGQTLSAELQPGKRWSEDQVMQLLQEVLSILEYVHSHGLIHRDIKPSNLIRRQQDGKIVLVDFGAVKQAWTQVVTAQGQTSTSFAIGIPATIAIGTPGYMPTEQGRGRPRPNSDIYALGVISIQALTGLQPTQLLEDSDTGEIIWQHHVQVSPALASVLAKMVRYHFQERYESATEALQAVQALCNHQALRRQKAVCKQPSTQQAAIGQRVLSATLVPEKFPASGQESIAVVRTNRLKPHLGSKTSKSFIPSFPNKSGWLIGIATSFAAALAFIVGSYYFLRSPGTVPEVKKSPVALAIKTPVFGNISLDNTLTGHSGSVWSVALSSNGQTVVSGSEDKTIKVWNLNNGQLLRTLAGHADAVRSLTLSSNGQILASGSGDKTIKLWNLQTGAQIRTFFGHSGPVWSVAISPDGQTLVSGSEDSTIKIWNLATGELHRTLVGHSGRVFAVAISPDGQTFATAGVDKTIKVWDLPTGKLLRTLLGHSDAVRAVVFSPDGQKLASSSWDKTIKVWELRTGKAIRTLEGHSDRVVSVAFSNDSQTLASASVDKTIKVWNWQTGKLLNDLSGHSDWVLSVTTSSTGQTLVSSSKDKTIKIWQR
jgi:serine/threonine protein kinase